MRYISENSRRALVNRLAEKISEKLSEKNKYNTIIEVVDCMNFLVVKGYTSSQNLLDLIKFKDEFLIEEKYFLEKIGIKRLNLIDIIQYKIDSQVENTSYWFEFWNSKRPIYNPKVIEFVENKEFPFETLESINYSNKLEVEVISPSPYTDFSIFGGSSPLTISSQFPFGYSLKCGKTKFYYAEYICNQLFSFLNTDKILFRISDEIMDNGDLGINIISNSQHDDKNVISLVLDIFDFNFSKFETDYLKDYNFINEITNPFETKPWINRDRVKELMIV